MNLHVQLGAKVLVRTSTEIHMNRCADNYLDTPTVTAVIFTTGIQADIRLLHCKLHYDYFVCIIINR